MKILIAGNWHSQVHEEPAARVLTKLGHVVEQFAWHTYFRPHVKTSRLAALKQLSCKFQNKYLLGPLFQAVNRDLLIRVQQTQPDMLFVYRGTHITAATLRTIRRTCPKTFLVGYNNDDPFSPHQPRWLWRHFVQAIPAYDLTLAYRQHNLDDFRGAGAQRVELLRSWFVPENNHPMSLSPEDRERFECDVVFVGHYEADHRIDLLKTVVRQGYRLRVFGPDYPKKLDAPELEHLIPILPVRGDDYNKALCGAKVALCFLSKLNRDTYTRRNFEIPATKTMMLSEYTDDLATLFQEGAEAAFFRTSEELTSKLALYLNNDELRESVAAAGFSRVWADGHDIKSRIEQLLKWLGVAYGTHR